MSDHNQPEWEKDDELDLTTILGRIFLFARKSGKILLIFIILGLAVGIAIFAITPKQYHSKLILHSGFLTNEEQIQIIEAWKDLLKNEEYTALASILQTDKQILGKITYINAEEIYKLNIQNNPNGFIVEVYVKDTSILDTLQSGIITGLESGDYIRNKIEIRTANLKELIEKVKAEIIKLDSVKSNVENFNNFKKATAPPVIMDISNINMQWIGMNEKLLAYQEDLKFVHGVQVLQNFAKLSKPDKPKLLKSIVLGLLGGFFIGYIVALTKNAFQKLKSQPRS